MCWTPHMRTSLRLQYLPMKCLSDWSRHRIDPRIGLSRICADTHEILIRRQKRRQKAPNALNIDAIYLCPVAIWLNGSPSSNHVKDGVGEPVAEQRKETGWPARSACSINVYCSSGTVSKKTFPSKMRFEERWDEREYNSAILLRLLSWHLNITFL